MPALAITMRILSIVIGNLLPRTVLFPYQCHAHGLVRQTSALARQTSAKLSDATSHLAAEALRVFL